MVKPFFEKEKFLNQNIYFILYTVLYVLNQPLFIEKIMLRRKKKIRVKKKSFEKSKKRNLEENILVIGVYEIFPIYYQGNVE